MPGPRQLALHRADVDDLAAPAPQHVARDCLRHMKRAVQVDAQQVVPVGGAEGFERRPALDAGIIHEDVDCADAFLERIHRYRDLLGLRHIKNRNIRDQTFVAQLSRDGGRLLLIAIVDDDSRARARQSARQREPDAAPGAGDQGAPSIQAEEFQCFVHFLRRIRCASGLSPNVRSSLQELQSRQ